MNDHHLDNNNPIRLKPENEVRIQQLLGDDATLSDDLSRLLDTIETLAHEVEDSHSFPPTGASSSAEKTRKKSRGRKRDSTRTGATAASGTVKTVHQLRQAVLDDGQELRDVTLAEDVQLLVNATTAELLHHDVVALMVQRFKTGSTPGNRAPDDLAKLALSIEGGGTCPTRKKIEGEI